MRPNIIRRGRWKECARQRFIHPAYPPHARHLRVDFLGYQGTPLFRRSVLLHPRPGGKDNRENGAPGLEVNEQTSFASCSIRKGAIASPAAHERRSPRDLRTAFGGSACNQELGGHTPCGCEVCAIMRGITIWMPEAITQNRRRPISVTASG